MKNRFIILSIFLSLIPFVGVFAQNDFKAEFAKYDSLPNINRLVYHGAITPNWIDTTTFWYETRDASGLKYYKVDVAKSTRTEWPKDSAIVPEVRRTVRRPPQDTVPSPNGQWLAILKDANIWLQEVATKQVTKLSHDGGLNNAYLNLYWSPDSKKLAAIKRQDAPMRKIPLIESSPASQLQPILQWRDYFKPGDLIPVNRPALFDIDTKTKIAFDVHPFEFQYNLRFGVWSSDSHHFTFEFNQRGHQLYQLIGVDAQTGTTWTVAEERNNTFVYYNRIYVYYTKDNNNVIWASERENWRHLYLIDRKTGKVEKPLTKGEWVVREVLHVNEEERYLILSGNGKNQHTGEDPYNIHFFRVNIDTGDIIDLTPENGNHRGYFSSDFKYMVDVSSRPDTPPVSVVRSTADGKVVMHLQKADISSLLKTGYTMPEVFHTKGRDGVTDIWGTIYRPSNFNPKKSYPVVEYIYAGPHDSFVTKDFVVYSRFSKLLELGFIVVSIDGMGTANRSKSFHDVAWRNLKDAGFPDRIVWIKEAAKRYRYMDITRMGIYGYSAGGQSTLGALLFHGDFYKVGVALCGCHDNRMDKIWWNEQWMGYPIGPWYAENSNVDNAHLLQGKLLLINGELDDNVDPTSTLQVVNALVKADKDFEQLYLPGYGHSLGDNYVTRKVFEFLVKHLRK
jgi:dipeptidyl aminopeptidase/acylaminoacyl peptidase